MERHTLIQYKPLFLILLVTFLSACAHQPPASLSSITSGADHPYEDNREEFLRDYMNYRVPASLCANAEYQSCMSVSLRQCMGRTLPFGKDCLAEMLEKDPKSLDKGRLGTALHRQIFCLVDKGMIYSSSPSHANRCLNENLVGSQLKMVDFRKPKVRAKGGAKPCSTTLEDGSLDAYPQSYKPLRYPEAALRKKLDGSVVLAGNIDENGQVQNMRVLRSTNAEIFNPAAIEAFGKMTFCKPKDAPDMPRNITRSFNFST